MFLEVKDLPGQVDPSPQGQGAQTMQRRGKFGHAVSEPEPREMEHGHLGQYG